MSKIIYTSLYLTYVCMYNSKQEHCYFQKSAVNHISHQIIIYITTTHIHTQAYILARYFNIFSR